jgi:SAM-dependent methyltransferase
LAAEGPRVDVLVPGPLEQSRRLCRRRAAPLHDEIAEGIDIADHDWRPPTVAHRSAGSCSHPRAFIGLTGSVQFCVSLLNIAPNPPVSALMPVPDRMFQFATLKTSGVSAKSGPLETNAATIETNTRLRNADSRHQVPDTPPAARIGHVAGAGAIRAGLMERAYAVSATTRRPVCNWSAKPSFTQPLLRAADLLTASRMPTVNENRDRWQHHAWAQRGDEWSPGRSAAGTEVLWHRTIFPRVRQFLPTDTIVEIGPGFGRWSQYLRHLCGRLILVDLSQRCIDACRQRFAADTHIEYVVNDGTSLEGIHDRTVDFIFSFDSLVHAEADAVGAYLAEAARTLKRGGAGFIHHSNLLDFVDPRTGDVRWFVTEQNWRATTMSAAVFRSLCTTAGLSCDTQELINWIGRGRTMDRHGLHGGSIPLTDCFSTFSTSSVPARPTRVVANPLFVDEWRQAAWFVDVYGRDGPDPPPPSAAREEEAALQRKLATAGKVRRREGWRGVAAVMWQQTASATDFIASFARARMVAVVNRWFLRRHLLRG